MSLPKITNPTIELAIPSTKEKVRFRCFLVKEEKVLLLAQKGDQSDMIFALKQIINNCFVEGVFDIDHLTTFDTVFIFLRLRAASVDSTVKLKYQDNEDDKIYEFEVDLNSVDVVYDPEHESKFKITDELGVIMRYPDIKMAEGMVNVNYTDVDLFNGVLKYCIKAVYDSETVYDMSTESDEEIETFINSLDLKSFEKIQKFFDTMPKIEYVIEYTNSKGSKRRIVLESIQDFFSWGAATTA